MKDILGKVSPGVTRTDEENPTNPCKVSPRPNINSTTKGKIPEQVSPGPETPSSSGQVSPELVSKILENQKSLWLEHEVTATRP